MAKRFFLELRERLLCAGVTPRHVRRYLAELADHLADLRAEEIRAGRSHEDAESTALFRLGRMDDLAQAMIEQPQFRSWCARAPWAIFSFAPLFLLAGAYLLAGFYLWFGWKVFWPVADTPFGHPNPGPIYGLENLYFQGGKFFYFGAPILVGWCIAFLGARQRIKAIWPTIGSVLLAWMGGTAQIHASRTAVPGGFGHIVMNFFTDYSDGLFHPLAILMLTLTPYIVWQLQKNRSLSA